MLNNTSLLQEGILDNIVISPEIYPFFGVIVGAVIGAFAAYLFALMIERKNRRTILPVGFLLHSLSMLLSHLGY
jgi:hypothetical protein